MNNNNNELEIRGKQTYTAVISSEYKVGRNGFDEVIIHNANSIDTSRFPLPLLLEHDAERQIGVVENPRLEGKKLLADIRFANDELAKTYESDVIDKVRNSLSIGYESVKSYMQDGIRYITETILYETSLVSMGADPTARFRKLNSNKTNFYTRSMKMEEEKKLSRNESRKLREEISEIRHIGKKHNMSDEADTFIENGNSLEQFRSYVMESKVNNIPLPTPLTDGLGNAIYRNAPAVHKGYDETFSLQRAIQGCLDPSKKGFEHEVQADYQRNQELKNEHGIIIPTEAVLGQRTMTAGNLGGNISDISDSSKLIPFVQRQGVYSSMGLTEFNGMTSDVKIPRGTSVATASFLSLDGTTDITEGTPTMDSVSMSPTSLACFTEVSHKLVLQSSLDMENYLRNLMSQSIGNKLDLAVIHGSGSSNQPTGMLNATGINTETYTSAIAYSDLANALSKLASDSIPLNGLSWVVHPDQYATLQIKDKGTDTGQFLLETVNNPADINQVGTMLGYPCYVSDHVPTGEVLLARSQHSALGFFGGLELDVNPYQDFQKGSIGIRAIQDFDFQVLNPNSICKIST